MAPRPKKASKKTPDTLAHRLERRAKARARHWRRTGVSDRTIQWMRDGGWL